MEPEQPTPLSPLTPASPDPASSLPPAGDPTDEREAQPFALHRAPSEPTPFHRVFIGPQGLRAGWSILLFVFFTAVLVMLGGSAGSWILKHVAHVKLQQGTPSATLYGEGLAVGALLVSMSLMALIEHRRLLSYNLSGRARLPHFLSGLLCGFAALSALVAALVAGHWMHFGPIALHGPAIAKYALLWAFSFLFVAFFEEGTFRCYLQFTLTRGINFWGALIWVAAISLDLLLRAHGNGVWGVYALALLGLAPCALLHLRKHPHSGFWQAAWATSTLFGFVHTGNNGENWIGIFAAGLIGFVFCVSIWATGSAWWAIGCHASWDWAETYFYGTADSGMVARGHLLTAAPAGSVFWSGGTDGPEGSVLVLPIVLLLLLLVFLLYRRSRSASALPGQSVLASDVPGDVLR